MINSFRGEYAFLSNFYPCTVKGYDDDISYASVEHAFQAAKTLNDEDRLLISVADVKQAKRMGRQVVLRSDWESIKLDVMESLLRRKFNNPHLKELLLETGDEELVEGNWWGDCYWGVCRGKGENHLGKLLMKVRSELCG